MSAVEIGALAAAGVDAIDASDDAITFNLAQYDSALGLVFDATDKITVNGTDGDDTVTALAIGTKIKGGAGEDTITGGIGDDKLMGNKGQDRLVGGAGEDTLKGGNNDDVLKGGSGDDTLHGGKGQDKMKGGDGVDTFTFKSIDDVGSGSKGRDLVTDFETGTDKIDLTGIDARSGGSDQAFTFIGTAGFSNTKGELRYKVKDNGVLIRADVDGDGTKDFEILLKGIDTIDADDFLL
ncbi:MAG TPA: hypothetical protein DIU07_05480 [Rhodobacteraceae bacterium]|nr:hypothetical protein [Paracoccaceae bacterium]